MKAAQYYLALIVLLGMTSYGAINDTYKTNAVFVNGKLWKDPNLANANDLTSSMIQIEFPYLIEAPLGFPFTNLTNRDKYKASSYAEGKKEGRFYLPFFYGNKTKVQQRVGKLQFTFKAAKQGKIELTHKQEQN
ncbi:uncharacterized protein G2W53_003792 [Senna tora]|uniref:Uncharacterized protein n=1 Tax=Senna tora TaxID=362788 RepID=A0A834XAR4_9FABA|nr:uncharacterized protein G2W53_003792 [Senna tora]